MKIGQITRDDVLPTLLVYIPALIAGAILALAAIIYRDALSGDNLAGLMFLAGTLLGLAFAWAARSKVIEALCNKSILFKKSKVCLRSNSEPLSA